MSPVDFSIVIPLFNCEKFFYECVESILNQNHTSYEIIVVDDGSVDNSSVLVDYCCNMSERVTVVHSKNRGVSGARNLALDLASGKYVLFIDSDDYFMVNDMFATIAKKMNENEYGFVVFGYQTEVSPNEMVVKSWKNQKVEIFDEYLIDTIYHSHLVDESLQKVDLIAWTYCFNREIIEKFHIRFDEERDHGEDVLFRFGVLSQSKTVLFMDEVYYFYRYSGTSLTHTYQYHYPNDISELRQKLKYCLDIYQSLSQRVHNTEQLNVGNTGLCNSIYVAGVKGLMLSEGSPFILRKVREYYERFLEVMASYNLTTCKDGLHGKQKWLNNMIVRKRYLLQIIYVIIDKVFNSIREKIR